MNLHGSQVQQKTMNPGSLFSLYRTDVRQISCRFNVWSWLFHQNGQRAEKPLPTYLALTRKKADIEGERKQTICDDGYREAEMILDSNLWSWPSPNHSYILEYIDHFVLAKKKYPDMKNGERHSFLSCPQSSEVLRVLTENTALVIISFLSAVG